MAVKTTSEPKGDPQLIEITGDVEDDFEKVFRSNSQRELKAVEKRTVKSANVRDDDGEVGRYSVTETGSSRIEQSVKPKMWPTRSRADLNRNKSGLLNAQEINLALEMVEQQANDYYEEVEIRHKYADVVPPPLPTSLPPGQMPEKIVIEEKRPVRTSIDSPAFKLKPWQKEHEYRPMSAVMRANTAPVVDHPKESTFFAPIVVSQSEENLFEVKEIPKLLTPQAIYASKSVQNLVDENPHDLTSLFLSKSSDDLIMPDIDGIRNATKSAKYKHMKNRQISHQTSSHSNLNDNDVYANLEDMKREVDQLKNKAAESDRRKAELDFKILPVVKKPQPLPRINSQSEIDRSSKTIVFSLDPNTNEFFFDQEETKKKEAIAAKNQSFVHKGTYNKPSLVPIVTTIPKSPVQGSSINKQFKSLESLDFEQREKKDNKVEKDRANFFGFRLFKKDKEKTEPEVRQSVFYSDSVELLHIPDIPKYQARIVHIDDDDEEEDFTRMEQKPIHSGRMFLDEAKRLSTFSSSDRNAIFSTFYDDDDSKWDGLLVVDASLSFVR